MSNRYTEMAAVIPDVGSGIQSALDNIGNAAVANPDFTAVAAVIVVSTVTLLAALRFVNRKPVDEAEEMRKRLLLDQSYADMIGDGLFEKLCSGEIDRHEYKRACRRFGVAFRLGDLLTRKNPKRGMRFRVANNCAEMHRSPSLAGKIPGPAIGTEVPASVLVLKPAVVQRKAWVVVGKVLSRR